MKNILINAANLHSGGAIAVASSFIKELSSSSAVDLSISLLISTDVSNNLSAMGVDLLVFREVVVKDYYGLSAMWNGLYAHLTGYDAVFTVFGPAYTLRKIPNHLVGFAQPNIIYPDNPVFKSLSLINKFKTRLQYLVQERFFSLASELVVELEHVRRGIENRGFFGSKPIHIVNSAVDAVFSRVADWLPVRLEKTSGSLSLGIISRNYPHKNLSILPDVKRRLAEDFNLRADFYVTFTAEEYAQCSADFRKNIVNVGPLKLAQCPSFYNEMDGVVFPSLLECFSAVPIETMMIKKPLFASDLPFIRDCCHNHANYFDPLNAEEIAKSIATFYSKSESQRNQFVSDANAFVHTYPGPDKRALAYLEIIRNFKN